MYNISSRWNRNANKLRTIAENAPRIIALIAIAMALAMGCSTSHEENVGQVSSAVMSPSSLNIPIAFTGNHETSVTYVKGAGGPIGGTAVGRWVMATNNFDTLSSNSN